MIQEEKTSNKRWLLSQLPQWVSELNPPGSLGNGVSEHLRIPLAKGKEAAVFFSEHLADTDAVC